MKDFAMEAILALGSGIVLAMFGIGVPDPNETKQAIEVFSNEVSNVIDKTFGAIVGQGPLVDNFTKQWMKLSVEAESDAALTKEQREVLALIVERVTRDAVQNEGGNLEEALEANDPHGAQMLVTAMADLTVQLQNFSDKSQKMQALKSFEARVQKGRGIQAMATFQKEVTMNAENIKQDAEKQLKQAKKVFNFGSPSTLKDISDHAIPRSPLMQEPRQGQQPLVRHGLDMLRQTLGTDRKIEAPPDDYLNVYFAMYIQAGQQIEPLWIAVRKRKDENDPKSAWINAFDDGPMVILHQPSNAYTAGGFKDPGDEDRRIWTYVIPEAPQRTYEIGIFMSVGLGVSTALTTERWGPFYGVTYKDGHDHIEDDTLFYETFLSSQMRERHSGQEY